MLHLTSHGLLGAARRAIESGPVRSAAISTVSGAVGLIAGKLEDARKTPLFAIGAGAALSLVGLHTLGDGAMAGGANIVGYRLGARMSRSGPQGIVTPGTPTVTRHRRRSAYAQR